MEKRIFCVMACCMALCHPRSEAEELTYGEAYARFLAMTSVEGMSPDEVAGCSWYAPRYGSCQGAVLRFESTCTPEDREAVTDYVHKEILYKLPESKKWLAGGNETWILGTENDRTALINIEWLGRSIILLYYTGGEYGPIYDELWAPSEENMCIGTTGDVSAE